MKDSVLYINQDYGKSSLGEIFYETWSRRSFLILVCDPRAGAVEKSSYYSLYKDFITASQKVLNDRSKAKYGKSINEIDSINRSGLGLAGVPFVLEGNIRNVEYLKWVDDFPSTEEMWKREIPLELIP